MFFSHIKVYYIEKEDKVKSLQISKAKILIGFLAGFLIGVFFGDVLKIEITWASGVIVGLIIALILFWKDQHLRLGLFILVGLLIGITYFRLWDNRQQAVNLALNQEINFEGQIVGHPEILGNQARYIVKYQNTKIQVTTAPFPAYHYGDKLKIKGEIKKSNDYLFHQGVLGVIYNPEMIEKTGTGGKIFTKILFQIRDKFENSLNKTLGEPYASFAAGLVLGSKRNIPDSLMADFNRTGTTHIVAVSGYNVTIIIISIGLLLGVISRKLKFWGSLGLILSFIILTGASASVVRAGLLTGLVAWGQFEGRRINMLILILLTAFLILLFNPYALKFDISFQLSFLAFVGLVYLSSPISNSKLICLLPDFLKKTLSETLGAQIMVLPILIYYFGQLSVVSPIVNVLILWLVPTAMLLVFLSSFIGLIWLPMGYYFSYITWIFLKYIIIVVESFSGIPWASFLLKLSSPWWLVVFYAPIIFWLIILRRKNVHPAQSAIYS